jgi:lipid A 3-O-deacylase
MNLRALVFALIALTGVTVSAESPADRSFSLESAGVRYGFGNGGLSHDFQQVEATVDFTLPRKWDLGRTWELKPRLELSLGSFGDDHVTAVIGSVGSILTLAPAKSPVALEVGVSATGLSEDEFETRGIGSLFQIRSLFGLSWTIEKRVRVGYHFQHMSNGGLAGDNQGLNMHTFSVAYCF